MIKKNKNLKILITNDDGIQSEGLKILTQTAVKFGEVTIVAPFIQCSGMSQKLTTSIPMAIQKIQDYSVKDVEVYSLDGTPVDCIKAAFLKILPKKPDIVFSGINFGYNAGFDCANSGTIGAVCEAITFGVPGIAFSNGGPENEAFSEKHTDYSVVRKYLEEIIIELLDKKIENTAFWNVNFPGCPLLKCKGILRNRSIGHLHPYKGSIVEDINSDGILTYKLKCHIIDKKEAPEGSDIHALLNNYISIGKIYNSMLL